MGFNLSTLNNSSAKSDTKVMVYSSTHIFWGKLGLEEIQMPERLLTGVNIPEIVYIKNCKYINSKHMGQKNPKMVSKLFIPTNNILGYHLMEDEKEIKPPEDNWIKDDVSILFGVFQISASIWIGPKTSLFKHLALERATYIDVFDASISIPELPDLKPIKTKKISLRKNDVTFFVE